MVVRPYKVQMGYDGVVWFKEVKVLGVWSEEVMVDSCSAAQTDPQLT